MNYSADSFLESLENMEPGDSLSYEILDQLYAGLPKAVSDQVRASLSYAMATENLGESTVTVRQLRDALISKTEVFLSKRKGVGGDEKSSVIHDVSRAA